MCSVPRLLRHIKDQHGQPDVLRGLDDLVEHLRHVGLPHTVRARRQPLQALDAAVVAVALVGKESVERVEAGVDHLDGERRLLAVRQVDLLAHVVERVAVPVGEEVASQGRGSERKQQRQPSAGQEQPRSQHSSSGAEEQGEEQVRGRGEAARRGGAHLLRSRSNPSPRRLSGCARPTIAKRACT